MLSLLVIFGAASIVSASDKHVLLISNPQMTLFWSEILEDAPGVITTVANEPDLLDDIFGVFDADQMAEYDAFVIGELFMEAGKTGAVLMPEEIQQAIQDRVAEGAGLVLAGGWNSYQGGTDDWAGNWHGTILAEVLPVNISNEWDTNDAGTENLKIARADHSIANGLDWINVTRFGGYNVTTAKDDSVVIMEDLDSGAPLIVAGTFGEGKTVAYTGGFGSGWDEDFSEWSDFGQLWVQIVQYLVD